MVGRSRVGNRQLQQPAVLRIAGRADVLRDRVGHEVFERFGDPVDARTGCRDGDVRIDSPKLRRDEPSGRGEECVTDAGGGECLDGDGSQGSRVADGVSRRGRAGDVQVHYRHRRDVRIPRELAGRGVAQPLEVPRPQGQLAPDRQSGRDGRHDLRPAGRRNQDLSEVEPHVERTDRAAFAPRGVEEAAFTAHAVQVDHYASGGGETKTEIPGRGGIDDLQAESLAGLDVEWRRASWLDRPGRCRGSRPSADILAIRQHGLALVEPPAGPDDAGDVAGGIVPLRQRSIRTVVVRGAAGGSGSHAEVDGRGRQLGGRAAHPFRAGIDIVVGGGVVDGLGHRDVADHELSRHGRVVRVGEHARQLGRIRDDDHPVQTAEDAVGREVMVRVIPVQAGTRHRELVEIAAADRSRRGRRYRELGRHRFLRDFGAVGRVGQLDAVPVNAGGMIQLVDQPDDHRVIDFQLQQWPRDEAVVGLDVRKLSVLVVDVDRQGLGRDDDRLQDVGIPAGVDR